MLFFHVLTHRTFRKILIFSSFGRLKTDKLTEDMRSKYTIHTTICKQPAINNPLFNGMKKKDVEKLSTQAESFYYCALTS